jgi:hypothetical protein
MHDDLLAQAEALATFDPNRPKQVNLRRAVSSTYYAMFHFLVNESCCMQLGTAHAQIPFRNALARAFNHTVMRSACNGYGGGTLRDSMVKGLPRDSNDRYAIPPEIQRVASTFSHLQEKRHLADYDRGERFNRSDVLMLIEKARVSIDSFAALPPSDDKRFFLACLWAWKELANR